jgi:tryptophanase
MSKKNKLNTSCLIKTQKTTSKQQSLHAPLPSRPFRIKMAESIRPISPEECEAALKEADYNLFAIKSIK